MSAIPAPPGHKGCGRCRAVKPEADFHRGKGGKRDCYCKPCKLDYRREQRIERAGKPDLTIAARFWPKVDKNGPNGCWNWIGAKSNRGYGAIMYQAADVPAHRVSMILAGHDADWTKFVVDHVCKNIACVNPAHLRICTQVENTGIYADRSKMQERWKATYRANRSK